MEALIFPILLGGVFYFILIRPQQRRVKAQQALVSRAEAGDRVLLSSGIYGTLTEVLDTSAYVELAEGIEILIARTTIQEILDHFPTEEAAEDDEGEDDGDEDLLDEIEDVEVEDAESGA